MSGGTAAALIIGNEILSGKIADKNLSVLARVLRSLGVELRRAVTIRDEMDVIVSEVRVLASAHTWLFTSGGVGPTHDDLTIEAVARAFDVPVEIDPELDALIRGAYGDKLREGHLLMARVPRGAKLVRNEHVPWPAVVMENVWVLPGVPEIFERKMTLVEDLVSRAQPFVSLVVVSGLDEGNLKPFLDRVVIAFPEVDVGSYPQWTDPVEKTRLTFDGRDRARCEAARAAFVESLPAGGVLRVEG